MKYSKHIFTQLRIYALAKKRKDHDIVLDIGCVELDIGGVIDTRQMLEIPQKLFIYFDMSICEVPNLLA